MITPSQVVNPYLSLPVPRIDLLVALLKNLTLAESPYAK
jgi:hypothetical protein